MTTTLIRTSITLTVTVAIFCALQAQTKPDNVKLAQTGMQFLSVVSDARAAALGYGVTAMPMGSSSLFFNPASMASTQFLDVSTSINQWIADIQHNTASFSIRPGDGEYGVFGVSLQSVDYGEIIGTIVDDSRPEGYVEFSQLGIANPKPTGMAAGLGYAKQLNTQFSIGGQVRYVYQNLGPSFTRNDTVRSKLFDTVSLRYPDSLINRHSVENLRTPIVFDFGTYFKTGYKSLVIAMSVRNFAAEVKYASESFELPLTFNVGVSMDMMDFFEDRSFISSAYLSTDAVHNRDYREQVFVGTEITVMKILMLRGGYVTGSDENNVSFGFGVSQLGLTVDYAYTPYGVFDKVQRISLRFAM